MPLMGVEEEYFLVDLQTGTPQPAGPVLSGLRARPWAIWSAVSSPSIKSR